MNKDFAKMYTIHLVQVSGLVGGEKWEMSTETR
jgi:hypothetical protein